MINLVQLDLTKNAPWGMLGKSIYGYVPPWRMPFWHFKVHMLGGFEKSSIERSKFTSFEFWFFPCTAFFGEWYLDIRKRFGRSWLQPLSFYFVSNHMAISLSLEVLKLLGSYIFWKACYWRMFNLLFWSFLILFITKLLGILAWCVLHTSPKLNLLLF